MIAKMNKSKLIKAEIDPTKAGKNKLLKKDKIKVKDVNSDEENVSEFQGISKRYDSFNAEDKKSSNTKNAVRKIKVRRPFVNTDGVIQIKNLPHGFYEEELEAFFKQFGVVTRVRVVRSVKTGGCKGFAYVAFKIPEVAEIAAETMNNYMMFKKILKTKYIAPENVSPKLFYKRVRTIIENDRVVVLSAFTKKRRAAIEKNNHHLTKIEFEQRKRKTLKKLQDKKRKMNKIGIDFDIDSIVKMPSEQLESFKSESGDENKEKSKQKKLSSNKLSNLSNRDQPIVDLQKKTEDRKQKMVDNITKKKQIKAKKLVEVETTAAVTKQPLVAVIPKVKQVKEKLMKMQTKGGIQNKTEKVPKKDVTKEKLKFAAKKMLKENKIVKQIPSKPTKNNKKKVK